ncbi:S8 family peptidase [Rhodoferax saidenbachensis]|uniref:Peptidase S8/S53 domain-containing protein n=1 Tax=Rhodoferax saidenbachensis TaxID=1484693 RepID=A0A1P8KA67_9BURK|nr:S8 family peptidase [Rhodoferax saidenbachensis]APW42894.1 hypothetical protein RS694_10345 [Rhodoferax saidenbachensis]
MSGPNLLLGNGQLLTRSIERTPSGGGGNKETPYTIAQARERLRPALDAVLDAVTQLPDAAKPRGEGTGVFTVHPAFQAKWLIPGDVFRRAGLRTVGSTPALVKPEIDARKYAPKGEQPTAELYVSGDYKAFAALHQMLMSERTGKGVQREFCKLEAIRFLTPQERLLRLDGEDPEIPIEIILHGNGTDIQLLNDLEHFSASCGARIFVAKHLAVPGLVFLPGVVPRSKLDEFATFTALRAVRRLPKLRLNRPTIREKLTVQAPTLPNEDALDTNLRVAVFDGGLGAKDFSRWSTEHVPPELTDTHADYLSHGMEVTSALLFGAVSEGATELERPYFNIAHHRVLGHADESDSDLYDCMRRIDAVLRTGEVDFANISLGPRIAIDDGQPHAWTSMLDGHLASGKTLLSVAVGNDGEIQGPMGRIQPPADAVNALAIGSADSSGFMWGRAAYSCVGPGRSPGLVKPDGLAFGGTESEPLVLLNPLSGGLCGVQGTSFASPLVLRTAAAACAMSETKLSATALRSLLIHRAERGGHELSHVGWGRFPASAEELLTCSDGEATVLYQGYFTAGGIMRIELPIPAVPLGVRLRITATFCFASPVDPADPVNYTRHGLTIKFRPQGAGSSQPFFSSQTHGSEQELRRDAHKWETVLHRSESFSAAELLDACFDVEHGAREHGEKVVNKNVPSLPYVLVATIASEMGEPVYQAVRQKFSMLTPINLRDRVQLRR